MEKVKVLRKHMAGDAILINKAGLEEVFYQALDNHIKDLKKAAKDIDDVELDPELILHQKLSGILIAAKVQSILFPKEED